MNKAENMEIYNACREVPKEAKKLFSTKKLKNFTDINPMWRIQKLTELFGVCGVGWYTDDVKFWTYEDEKVSEVNAFCTLALYIKANGEWSKPIFGVGGSKMITNYGKLDLSDEAYKMAYTDAISVACKALGIGADVYWEGGRTKYLLQEQAQKQEKEKKQQQEPKQPKESIYTCKKCGRKIPESVETSKGTFTAKYMDAKYGCCMECLRAETEKKQAEQAETAGQEEKKHE